MNFTKQWGQFNDYYVALEIEDPTRILFLAIPDDIWFRFFQKQVIQKSLKRIQAKIIVYDPKNNEVVTWIN